jgi:hypothetical protein
MIKEFSTIHIFRYGEAQIITNEFNFKASFESFTKLQSVIDDIKSQKPSNVTEGDFHAINIFKAINCRYMGREKETSFSCDLSDLNESKLNDLIDEFVTLRDSSSDSNPIV